MRVSASQLNVHHSALDEVNNDIKDQVKIITENYNGKGYISELNVQNVADKYGVSFDIAKVMINNDIGDYTMVAKLVILQREGVSFFGINKFAINHDDSMEDFVSALFTSNDFKTKYFFSGFEDKVYERVNYISGTKISDETRFYDLYSFIKKNSPEYIDLVDYSHKRFDVPSEHQLAMLMVLKDNGASNELLHLFHNERRNYNLAYLALNCDVKQNKIIELSNMLFSWEINEKEFINQVCAPRSDHEIDDNKQGGDTGEPLLKEAIPLNSDISESDINSLTNNLSATLDNSELVATNLSSAHSNPWASLGNLLAVS